MIQIEDVEGKLHNVANHMITMISPDDRRPDLTVLRMACGTAIRVAMEPDHVVELVLGKLPDGSTE